MAVGLYVSAIFFFCSWCVLLGGLASLQSSCDNTSSEVAAWATEKNLTSLAAYFTRIDGYGTAYYNDYEADDPVCARIFGFQWFLLFWALIIAGLGTACASPSFARVMEGGVQANFAAILVLLMWFTKEYNTFLWRTHDDLPSELESRLNCTLAGYILLAVAVVVFIFGVSGKSFDGLSISLRRGGQTGAEKV